MRVQVRWMTSVTKISSGRIACAISRTALIALAMWPRLSMADPRTPIEVELQTGVATFDTEGNACAPGHKGFDDGFRAALRLSKLVTLDTARRRGVIPNAFCLASEKPGVKPLRVRVRIRCDGAGNFAFGAQASHNPGRGADHWLANVAVPFHAIRFAPALWRRSSLSARSDRENYCETMGRVVALYVLEALHRESGQLRPQNFLDLGPDVSRDPKYSEADESSWKRLTYWLVVTLPAAAAWTVLLLVSFATVLTIRVLVRRSHGRHAGPAS